jgi:hypothetical protein
MYSLSEEELIVILTNKFAALENFHDTGEINRAWDTIKENIKILAKEGVDRCELKHHKP